MLLIDMDSRKDAACGAAKVAGRREKHHVLGCCRVTAAVDSDVRQKMHTVHTKPFFGGKRFLLNYSFNYAEFDLLSLFSLTCKTPLEKKNPENN